MRDDMAEISNSDLLDLTAAIVAAQVGNNDVGTDQVPSLIQEVHQALSGLGAEPEKTKQSPAVPIKKSVRKDAVICLECGYSAKMLRRHLSSAHDLSADQYRERWRLPSDYSMVAPDYAAKRSRLAKKIGLGKKPRKPKKS
jgi:predicted transcriptional regulator